MELGCIAEHYGQRRCTTAGDRGCMCNVAPHRNAAVEFTTLLCDASSVMLYICTIFATHMHDAHAPQVPYGASAKEMHHVTSAMQGWDQKSETVRCWFCTSAT